MVIFIPLLPAAALWDFAYQNDWEIDYLPIPHVITAGIYIFIMVLNMAMIFPAYDFSRLVWNVLDNL